MRGEEVRKKLLDGGYKLKLIAESLNISPQAFNSKLNTKNVTLDTFNDISKAINKSVDFFLSDLSAKPLTNSNFLLVPLVGQYAYAGYLSGFSDTEYIESLPTVPFFGDHEAKGEYMAFETKGDSMDDDSADAIKEGDILIGRKIKQEHWRNKLHIKKWDFIIIHKTEGILIKRIISHNVETAEITIHSLNPDYSDKTLSLNDVSQLLNVIQVSRNRKR